MTLKEIVRRLNLTVCSGTEALDIEVTGGYASDLLSDVIAHSKTGNVWVTMQAHENIIAVAILKDLAAIILVNGRSPAEHTLQKAIDEHVTILASKQPAFETIGQLYELGVGRQVT
jgi:hypothetical protein